MKQCSRCLEVKALESFTACNTCKDGYRSYCKACHSQYKHKWYKQNQKHCYEKAQAWIKANNEKNKEYKKKYQSTPKAKAKAIEYKTVNKERIALKKQEWAYINRGRSNAIKQKYKIAKLTRTPKWLTVEDYWVITEIYNLAALRTKMTGFAWHVDHIIPLQGKTVCGLHVPLNLQVIPGVDNIRKYNKYDETT